MFYVNDAEYGGVHNPDQILITPIHYQGELVAWCASMGHEPGTGAIQPGLVPPFGHEPDEDLHIPPIKIGANYLVKSDMLELTGKPYTGIPARRPLMSRPGLPPTWSSTRGSRISLTSMGYLFSGVS